MWWVMCNCVDGDRDRDRPRVVSGDRIDLQSSAYDDTDRRCFDRCQADVEPDSGSKAGPKCQQ